MSFCRSYSYSKRLDQLSKNEVYYNNLKHRQVICNNYENFLNNDPEIDGEKRRDYIYKVDFKNLNNKLQNWSNIMRVLLELRGNWKYHDTQSNVDFSICNSKNIENRAKIIHNLLNFNIKVCDRNNIIPKSLTFSEQRIINVLKNIYKKYSNKWFICITENFNKKYSNFIIQEKNNYISIDNLLKSNYIVNTDCLIKCYTLIRVTKDYNSINVYNKLPIQVILKQKNSQKCKKIVLECSEFFEQNIYNTVIYPQIINLIKDSVKCNFSEDMNHNTMNSFQLLTFRIILDKHMKCWLKKVSSDIPNLSHQMFNCFYDERYHKCMFVNSVLRTCVDPIFRPLFTTSMENNFVNIYKKNHVIENLVKYYIMPRINLSNGENITLLRHKYKFNELMISLLTQSNICPKHYLFSTYDKKVLNILKEFKEKYNILFLKPYSESFGYKRKISNNIQDVISWISKNKKNCKKWTLNEYINNPMLFYMNGERPSGHIYNDQYGRKNIIRICVLKIFTSEKVTTYMNNKKILLVSPRHYDIRDNVSLIANYDIINNISNDEHVSKDFYYDLDTLDPNCFEIKTNNFKETINKQISRILKLVSQHFIKNIRKNMKKSEFNLKPSFHMFTYDFLIDKQLKLWLLKVNSQPSEKCLKNLLDKNFNSLMKNVIDLFNCCQEKDCCNISHTDFRKVINVKVR